MQFYRPDKTALMPARAQIDRRRFTPGADVFVEYDVLDLTVAEHYLDAVQLDVVVANAKPEPLEPALVAADIDDIVIVPEADMTLAEPLPFPRVRRACGKQRDDQCYS